MATRVAYRRVQQHAASHGVALHRAHARSPLDRGGAGVMSTFSPDPSWPTIIELATELWGQPTERHHDNTRFGSRGSKVVKLSTGEWFDHEANDGGGYKALWQ